MEQEHKSTEVDSHTDSPKDDTITIRKDQLWKYSTFVLLALVVVGGFVLFSGEDGGITGAVVAPTPSAPSPTPGAVPTPSATAKVDLNKVEHIKGDPNAKITIVEWSDFECPFCGRFYEQTLAQIQTEYIDTGKVKFGYEHFPLSFHPQAQKAGEASECAGLQGKFWEMHDLLFESGVQGGVTAFKSYAGQIGLNQADFDSCLDSGETASKVQTDFKEGQAAGVRGTPGFAIVAADGTVTPLSGAQPFSAFDAALKAAGA